MTTENELREGLAIEAARESMMYLMPESAAEVEEMVRAAIAAYRAHDGHAEFVNKVREFAKNIGYPHSHDLIALCDAELTTEGGE